MKTKLIVLKERVENDEDRDLRIAMKDSADLYAANERENFKNFSVSYFTAETSAGDIIKHLATIEDGDSSDLQQKSLLMEECIVYDGVSDDEDVVVV